MLYSGRLLRHLDLMSRCIRLKVNQLPDRFGKPRNDLVGSRCYTFTLTRKQISSSSTFTYKTITSIYPTYTVYADNNAHKT